MEVECPAGGDAELQMKCDEDQVDFKPLSLQADKKEDGSTEPELSTSPKGSASGSTSVQIPVSATVHGQAGGQQVANTNPQPDVTNTPIITGVMSGEEAEKVLTQHSVHFTSDPPSVNLKTPPKKRPAPQQTTPPSQEIPASHKKPRKEEDLDEAGEQLRLKAEPGHRSPPDCTVCSSRYKFIRQLRGFMCLCSPSIAESLKTLKKKKNSRAEKKEKKKQTFFLDPPGCSTSKTFPSKSPEDDDYDSCTDTHSPHPHCPAANGKGKLVILVEDFYYGSVRGQNLDQHLKNPGPFDCIHCSMVLENNIKLMRHMTEHVFITTQQGAAPASSSCSHCYRCFLSPFSLQHHLEAVHSCSVSAATCRICELDFGSEPEFLLHMKQTHKPGEMPYVCQVCDFRSSFYSDVWSHFEEAHVNTRNLMCQFCLQVLHSPSCYQNHFSKHQRKTGFSCDKCRLRFLFQNDCRKHRELHKTHIKPAQLTGLKPGTKVTVRMYSMVGEGNETGRDILPCRVVNITDPSRPRQKSAQKEPLKSLGPLLSNLREEVSLSHPSLLCVECLSSISDVTAHFPSMVCCSLCKFITCCSISYANHMINNHVVDQKEHQYQSMFLFNLKSTHRLECVSCDFRTCRGDVMANHLTERPEHDCRAHTGCEVEHSDHQGQHRPDVAVGAGDDDHVSFIPLQLTSSTQLSVRPLSSPAPLTSPPAMSITIKRLSPSPEQSLAPPLDVSQLSAVLCSLCRGLLQASHRCDTPAADILSWTDRLERWLQNRKWQWRIPSLATLVLRLREQQLVVSEDVLLQEAQGFLGQQSSPTERYCWATEFLLNHDPDLRRGGSGIRLCQKKIRKKIGSFKESLQFQIHSNHLPLGAVACMDEFSIFIKRDAFQAQSPASFQLLSCPEDERVFDVVLSALSDGTFLPPLLFFRGRVLRIPRGFPDNVLLEARKDGFSDREQLSIWLKKVWCPHVMASGSDRKSLLLVDSHRGHMTGPFRKELSFLSTDLMVIPAHCSCRLQPLHVCVTPVLRDFLQARWIQLVSQGGLDGLRLDLLALMLACWLSEVCSTLNFQSHFLFRSFSSVCDQQQMDDCSKAAMLTKDLTRALETPGPVTRPELLMVLAQDKLQQMQEAELQQDVSLRCVDHKSL